MRIKSTTEEMRSMSEIFKNYIAIENSFDTPLIILSNLIKVIS